MLGTFGPAVAQGTESLPGPRRGVPGDLWATVCGTMFRLLPCTCSKSSAWASRAGLFDLL
jgi:hypothetical protein